MYQNIQVYAFIFYYSNLNYHQIKILLLLVDFHKMKFPLKVDKDYNQRIKEGKLINYGYYSYKFDHF